MSRHYIRVRTGGPIQDGQDVVEQRATFSRLVSVIQDEIDDVTDEYLHQIQESVLAAIRFCERERFYFNESMDVVFNTQKGKSIYGAPETSHIETSAKIKGVFLHRDRQAKVELEHKDAISLGPLIGSGQTGAPVCYGYFDRKLYLYPIPDNVYQIQLILSPIRFEYPANANQQNPWFIHAFDLIKARAKYELYKNILKDPDCAAAAYNDFQEQLQQLRSETSTRNNVTKIVPTDF